MSLKTAASHTAYIFRPGLVPAEAGLVKGSSSHALNAFLAAFEGTTQFSNLGFAIKPTGLYNLCAGLQILLLILLHFPISICCFRYSVRGDRILHSVRPVNDVVLYVSKLQADIPTGERKRGNTHIVETDLKEAPRLETNP